MKPKWLEPDKFHAELTGRTERSFLVRRHVYRCFWDEGFALQDRYGNLWRPARVSYLSDGASVPHPLDWVVPALDSLRYRHAAMGIHDPAYRMGELDCLPYMTDEWRVVPVTRRLADSLLAQGVDASGGWKVTQGAYWVGVRIPNWLQGR